MNGAVRSRLPGIYFQTVVPAPPEALPRMDVAAFVGFASCGPINIPVMVEDIVRFRDVFGEDLPLAWDEDSSEILYAHLAPSVEAFFRNGGRRCWIVRVAEGAVYNRFPLPGLIHADTGRRAVARSRCAGAFSDEMRVGSILSSRLVPAESFMAPGSGSPPLAEYALRITSRAENLEPGSLLCLSFGEDILFFWVLSGIETRPQYLDVRGEEGRWFRTRDTLPVDASTATVRIMDGSEMNASSNLAIRSLTYSDSGYDVRLIGSDLFSENDTVFESLSPGNVLHLTFADERSLWLSIREVNTVLTDTSPPDREIQVIAEQGYWPVSADNEASILSEIEGLSFTVKHLKMELLTWDGQEINARLPELTFSGAHRRAWTRLPVDDALFALEDDRFIPPESSTLAEAVLEPRFPLAGPEMDAETGFYIPFGMGLFPDRERTDERLLASEPTSPVEPEALSALERNGLSAFSSTLFLDPELALSRLGALVSTANDKLYQRQGKRNGAP